MHRRQNSHRIALIAGRSLEPVRIFALPTPGIDTHGIDVSFGTPTDEFSSKCRISIAGGNITWPARSQFIRYWAAAGFFECFDYVKDAIAGTCAKVYLKALRLVQALKRLQMAERQVDDVDVVTHASTIRRRVVISPDFQLVAPADGDLSDERHQVVRDALWVFADQAAFVGADRVEVAQDADPPSRIGAVEVAQHVFDDELGPAVGVGCRERVIFGQWQELRFAVDGG